MASPSKPIQTDDRELIEKLIARPLAEKLREQKYRCAQAIVFGLPVIALQYFGPKLGGAESPRFIAVMQAILSGWVTYIAVTGMISEGLILFLTRRQLTLDLLVAAAAAVIELISIAFAVALIFGRASRVRPMFHVVVIVLIVWTGLQWFRLSLQLKLVQKFESATQK